MSRCAEEFAVAHDLQRIAIGFKGGCRRLELLVADKLLDLEIVERPGGVELRVLGARGLPQFEIEDEIAFGLPFDGRGIDREARLAAQRFSHEQIGERVGRSGHVGPGGSVDDRSRRGVGDGEDEIVRLHAPRWREDHGRVIA